MEPVSIPTAYGGERNTNTLHIFRVTVTGENGDMLIAKLFTEEREALEYASEAEDAFTHYRAGIFVAEHTVNAYGEVSKAIPIRTTWCTEDAHTDPMIDAEDIAVAFEGDCDPEYDNSVTAVPFFAVKVNEGFGAGAEEIERTVAFNPNRIERHVRIMDEAGFDATQYSFWVNADLSVVFD